MNKDTLQRIKYLATLIFNDAEYTKLVNALHREDYNNARLIVDIKMEEFELLLATGNHDEESVVLFQYQMCEELDDIVTDLVVNEIDERERKQVRSIAKE